MRIDHTITKAFDGRPGSRYRVRSARPEGLSLRLTFAGDGGTEIDLKIYPAGEAASTCASNRNFDIVYQSQGSDAMDDEKRRMLESVVETLLGLEENIAYGDWEETLGEEADSRFLCGPAVEIKITRRCNQSCIFCKSSSKLENYAMPFEMPNLLRRLVKKSDFLTLSGGETCLDPFLESHLAEARKAGFRSIEVQTNGMLMQDRPTVRRLAAAGMTNALVSLHSHDPEISDAITRCRGGYEATVAGIRSLLAEDAQVSLCHVICSLNVRHIPDYVRFVRKSFPGSALSIVFTLAIPTYRVRGNPGLMPRLSELAPFLKSGLSMCSPARDSESAGLLERVIWKVESIAGAFPTTASPAHKLLRRARALVLGGSLQARVISHCGIPMCIIRGYETYHDEYSAAGSFPADIDLFHPDSCAGCRWRGNCSGIWRLYAAHYGVDEISPL
jgi:pyruvate-formate lyase-activating enzyme